MLEGNEIRNAKKRLHVMKEGAERRIRLLLIVEEFRLAFYISFILITITGKDLLKFTGSNPIKGVSIKPL